MIYIENLSTNPYFNLALEEYLLTQKKEEYFLLWQNHNTIVVGKNQNTAGEINSDFVKEHEISVVRRLTGGGAVYHDMGNLNFTFIVENSGEWFSQFNRFTDPVIRVLRELGAPAENSGRNDILVEGAKISGNAQTVHKNRLMHHGTLLFSADLAKLSGALKVSPEKISGKGISSVRSRVTNISEHLEKPISVLEFKELLVESFGLTKMELSPEEIEEVNRLANEKYETWEWNYGTSPKYTYKNRIRFAGGVLEVCADIKKGVIESIRFFGDFFGVRDISELEQALCGIQNREEVIKGVLSKINLDSYLLGCEAQDIYKLLDH